uniref:NADH dehydrogenase subunit 4L n=1 Tax=Cyanidium caldarium TaxID=2771 RepID=A0A7H0WBC7_CYACA|nr:NADH dehydrogenase subunit 4L [Cyanidium caldarium]QNR39856.1 NADH dehydrogenase subunit 4L [Cyanidium caldarium]
MIYQIHYLSLSIVLFLLSIIGIFLNRKNILIMLISIELILLSINLIFISSSFFLDDIIGQIFALMVLSVAAAESSIGLAILVVYYRIRGNISVELINLLKG